VIKNANADLAVAAAAGCTVSIDGLHSQVVAQRFRDDAGWKLQGYAIPFLFPQIGDWSWQQITDLRRDRNMARSGWRSRRWKKRRLPKQPARTLRPPCATHMNDSAPAPS